MSGRLLPFSLATLRPSAQLLCRMSVLFICALVAVLRPTPKLAGAYTYLIITAKVGDLSFPPSTNPSAQVEALVVNMIGVLIGLGWSNLGLACAAFAARRYGPDSSESRAIRACFLVFLGFLAGLVRSRMPRLTLASRAVCFIGIWLLARTPETPEQWNYRYFTELLFIFSVAGAASLFVSLVARIFTHPGGYAKDVIDALGILKDLLHNSTSRTFSDLEKSMLRTETLHSKSLDKALALHTSYAYSAYELRIGRVPIKVIKPLLITVNRIREELAWGNVPALEGWETPSGDTALLAELDDPCRACSSAIIDGISTLQAAVGKCYGIKLPNNAHKSIHLNDPLLARTVITNARAELKGTLDSVVHGINKTSTLSRVEGHHKELFRKSLHSASLLHISSELIRALTLAHAILEIHHTTSTPHVFFLRPSWFWLGMSPRTVVAEEDSPVTPGPSTELDTDVDADTLSLNEARTVLLPIPTTTSPSHKWSLIQIMRTPVALQARINLSNWLWRARHSKHVQHAIKNALGIALLLIPAVLPASSSGKKYYDSNYGVWAIISFVYVLEPNTALTWRIGIWRLCGTGLGALYAYTTWRIAGTNPYGVVALVTVAEIFLTWLVRSSTPGVGVVASVTIPPVLFIPYLKIGHTSMLHLAGLRTLQIAIGIIAAILINHVLFPKHPRVMFLSGMAKVLEDTRELYSGLSRRTLNDRHPRSRPDSVRGPAHKHSNTAKLELRLRVGELVAREKMYLSQMEHELSLMPKPTSAYREATNYAQRLVDLVAGLRRIREDVPHTAIDSVLVHRQRAASCITLSLFACEHAFRSRRALPQVLPSARKALDALNSELMNKLQSEARATDIGYAMAENEVIEEMVHAVEGLVQITRGLFGTSAWLSDIHDFNLGIGLVFGHRCRRQEARPTELMDMNRASSTASGTRLASISCDETSAISILPTLSCIISARLYSLPGVSAMKFLSALGLLALLPLVTRAQYARKCTSLEVRKEWRSFTKAERKAWIDATNCLNKRPSNGKLELEVDTNSFDNPAWRIAPYNESGTYYDDLIYAHMNLNPLIHWTGRFLPWHRYDLESLRCTEADTNIASINSVYLFEWTNILREECGYEGVVPYWAWEKDTDDFEGSEIWDTDSEYGLGGFSNDSSDDYVIHDGALDIDLAYPTPHRLRRHYIPYPYDIPVPFNNSKIKATDTFTPEEVKKLLAQPEGNYTRFQSYMESLIGMHSSLHLMIGGDMGTICPAGTEGTEYCPAQRTATFSTNDVAHLPSASRGKYNLNRNIDRLWWLWQEKSSKNKNAFYGGSVQNVSSLDVYPNGQPPWLSKSSRLPNAGNDRDEDVIVLSDSDSEHIAKRARRATPTFDSDTDSETHPDLSTRSDSEPDPYTTSEPNTDDEPDPTAEPSATHVETFFSKYRSFTFNATQPIMAEFYRLCAFTLVDREKARQGFRDALTRDFNEMYGVDEDDLGSWQRLCRAVVAKVPDDIEECRKIIRSRFVNIVDLVDTRITGIPVLQFESEAELKCGCGCDVNLEESDEEEILSLSSNSEDEVQPSSKKPRLKLEMSDSESDSKTAVAMPSSSFIPPPSSYPDSSDSDSDDIPPWPTTYPKPEPVSQRAKPEPFSQLFDPDPVKPEALTQTNIHQFFSQYSSRSFSYNPSQPVMSEFHRMVGSKWFPTGSQAQVKREMEDALTKDFNVMYGTDVDDLKAWKGLCRVLEFENIPDDLEECRRLVAATYVNIVDLIDTKLTGKPVQHFNSELELSKYTKKHRKFFPRNNVHSGTLLKFLLRRILSPTTATRDNPYPHLEEQVRFLWGCLVVFEPRPVSPILPHVPEILLVVSYSMSDSSTLPDITGTTVRPLGIRCHRSLASSKHVSNQEPGPDAAAIPNIDRHQGCSPASSTNINYDGFDEYGAELGPDARVWKTYVKEADKFDMEQVNGWNRFVVESSKSLKEDPPERSAARLDQITHILLVIANVSSPSQLNTTQIIDPDPFSPRPIDLCVNALWFFALILSAAVSLIAMLAKEWCQSFMSGRIGDPWSQTKRRQQRWKGIERWKMEQVVMFLPSLIHVSVLSFAVGLCLYLGDLHFGMAIPASLVTAGSILVYVASTFLPLLDDTCPYSTTIYRLIKAWFNLPKKSTSTHESDSERESIAIRALAWLIETCEEPRSVDIALQAIAGAHEINPVHQKLLRDQGADILIYKRLIAINPYVRNHARLQELYSRAYSFFHRSSDTKNYNESIHQNKKLRSKLYKLGNYVQRQTFQHVSSVSFIPSTHNIEALRVGTAAAPHCLQSLVGEASLELPEPLEYALDLLEAHCHGEKRVDQEPMDYLVIGVAILLSRSAAESDSGCLGRVIMRLVRMSNLTETYIWTRESYRPYFSRGYLGLLLMVFALSRSDHPGWSYPAPLSSTSRTERALEAILHYAHTPERRRLGNADVHNSMIDFGLLELLSDPAGYQLTEADFQIISETFVIDSHTFPIHTLPKAFRLYHHALEIVARMLMDEDVSVSASSNASTAYLVALYYVSVLHRSLEPPPEIVYTFVIECVYLQPPNLESLVSNASTALDLLQCFHNHDTNHLLGLFQGIAEPLGKRGVLEKLRELSEIDDNRRNISLKLFGIGQTWLLVHLALESGSADCEEWRTCWNSFTQNEDILSSQGMPDIFREERRVLAARSSTDMLPVNMYSSIG
ncbi:Fusaric acid resistance protein-like [Rhizoctonia solani]|uniref:Fusaric acid resistance protein-like n=1 Tax=Rhizoctonia solani TaxID=456999 RepID=A0A8H7LM37_9AGAM|nr:Fusaric acid resistance protein-like [Rhizoctonia solani]